jgi:flagellar hook-associated protein 1 FlgK
MTQIIPTSVFGSLDLARRALTAHQLGVQVAGHNLANATTPGYSRERTELVPQPDRRGVNVESITRIRDRFLDFALITEQQALGKHLAQQGLLQRIQAVVTDPPGEGLSAVLDQLFQGFQDLSTSPTNQAARFEVQDAGERLAQTFQVMRAHLDQIKSDLTLDIQERVLEANELITQIADLNRQIVPAQALGSPNDLLDRRDVLVSQLAEIAGVTQTDRSDGTVQLALSGTGVLLVDGLEAFTLEATVDLGTDTVSLSAGGSLPILPKSGRLGALLENRNLAAGPLKQAMTDLDTLAATIALEVNRLHTRGTGTSEHAALTAANAVSGAGAALNAAGLAVTPVDGSFRIIVHDGTGAVTAAANIAITAATTTLTDVQTAINAVAGLTATITAGKLTITAAAGQTFTFANDTSDTLAALGLNTFFTGSTAASLAVNPVITSDATKIASAVADGADLVHPGDGANALALAQLRTALTMAGDTKTFTEFYGAVVGRVGTQMQTANEGVVRQEAALHVVESLQQQVSGVSTDEEMINLSQSQTAYAAAARFATTINTLIGTLLDAFRPV